MSEHRHCAKAYKEQHRCSWLRDLFGQKGTHIAVRVRADPHDPAAVVDPPGLLQLPTGGVRGQPVVEIVHRPRVDNERVERGVIDDKNNLTKNCMLY